jgi:hypothetical protein
MVKIFVARRDAFPSGSEQVATSLLQEAATGTDTRQTLASRPRMSSQKPGGTQATLFSFFGKQPSAASSSSPAQRNTPRAAPKPGSSTSKQASKANGSSAKALTTSEADVLTLLSSDGPEVELEQASSTVSHTAPA